MGGCKRMCEGPKCDWTCDEPDACPEPKCHLSCDEPVYSNSSRPLPPLGQGMVSVQNFAAPTPSLLETSGAMLDVVADVFAEGATGPKKEVIPARRAARWRRR